MSQRILPIVAGVLALFCAAVVAAAAPDDEVLLSRGEIAVTRGDLMHMLETSIPEGGRAGALADNQKVRQLIADLFVIRVFAAQARQAGLDQDPAMRFKLAVQEDRTLMAAALDTAVAAEGTPDFEKTARERYTANPGRFLQPERVRASHILITVKEGRDEAQARALAEDLRKQALEGKKSFEDLARENSDDQSVKTNKGDLGFFARDRMVGPFADAAFAMSKPGEISPVVETQFGFHVIRYAERKPERQLNFDEVKKRLIEQEQQKYAARIRGEKIEAVRSLEGINVNQDAITAISAASRKAAEAATSRSPKKAAP